MYPALKPASTIYKKRKAEQDPPETATAADTQKRQRVTARYGPAQLKIILPKPPKQATVMCLGPMSRFRELPKRPKARVTKPTRSTGKSQLKNGHKVSKPVAKPASKPPKSELKTAILATLRLTLRIPRSKKQIVPHEPQSQAPTSNHTLPPLIKPKMNKSSRLTRLLTHYPNPTFNQIQQHNQSTSSNSHPTHKPANPLKPEEIAKDLTTLEQNKNATNTEEISKLAFDCFCFPEEGRSERNKMLDSGDFPREDVVREEYGIGNALPEWKKWKTGRWRVGGGE